MAFLAAALPAVFSATASTAAAAGSVAGVSAAVPMIATSTLASALPSLSTLAGVAGLAGSVLSAASQVDAGKTAETVAKINAANATEEAKAKNEAAKAETYKLSRQANQTAGEQRAAYGATGFNIEGSPLEVMANTAREYERDMLYTGYAGAVGANQKMNEANLLEWQGKQQKKTSMWGAGTTLLTGFGNYGLSKVGGRRYY
jgi:uncharacterized cupredoxin-like copper-binding protein